MSNCHALLDVSDLVWPIIIYFLNACLMLSCGSICKFPLKTKNQFFLVICWQQSVNNLALTYQLAKLIACSSSQGMEKQVVGKMVLQQCVHAKLQTNAGEDMSPPEYVEISRGLVIYVCFYKGADEDSILRMAKIATSAKLSKGETRKLVSVVDLPGDILIVPQATLGGKMKGKSMQYHDNIEKEIGFNLYKKFVDACSNLLRSSGNETVQTRSGIYGNLQVLNLETNGPYTHVIDVTKT